MENKYHFVITRYCPVERLFDGMMSFSEAHRFMDKHACFDRRVGFKVYNDSLCMWQDFKDSYFGGRKVYDNKGCLFILDPDYRGMKCYESQLWHLWFVRSDGTRMFIQSFGSEVKANLRLNYLTSIWKDGEYVVVPSDIKIDVLC